MVYIYALIDTATKEVRYIGKTVNPGGRLRAHCQCRGANPRLDNWIKKLKRKGLKPEIVVVEEVVESDWKLREQYWIAYYREIMGDRLINIGNGGGGPNLEWTEERRKAMSDKIRNLPEDIKKKVAEAQRAADTGTYMLTPKRTEHLARLRLLNIGRKPSPEKCAQISAALTGKHLSDEAKANLSVALRDRIFTDTHKAKISAARMGHLVSEETRVLIREARERESKMPLRRVVLSNGPDGDDILECGHIWLRPLKPSGRVANRSRSERRRCSLCVVEESRDLAF
jgi:hypothetical protein